MTNSEATPQTELNDGLAIRARNEAGEELLRPDAAGLAALVEQGCAEEGDAVVAVRVPYQPHDFLLVGRLDDDLYLVEYAEGDEEPLKVEVSGLETATRLAVGWARQDEGWSADLDWQIVEDEPDDEEDQEVELDEESRQELIEEGRQMLRVGYLSFDDMVEWMHESAEADAPISENQAQEILTPLWRERLAEQAGWPATTDCDRLDAAFEALNANGIVAEPQFSCCLGCGNSEILAELGSGDRGYTFFHDQDCDRAADGGGLLLAFGAAPGAGEDALAIGHEVVEALTGAGLSVEWNGDIDQRIHVTPMDWRRRLQ